MLRALFWLILLAAVVWFGTSVPLGSRTLFGHLLAIARTKEAKELAQGTEEEARRVADRVKRDLSPDGGASGAGTKR